MPSDLGLAHAWHEGLVRGEFCDRVRSSICCHIEGKLLQAITAKTGVGRHIQLTGTRPSSERTISATGGINALSYTPSVLFRIFYDPTLSSRLHKNYTTSNSFTLRVMALPDVPPPRTPSAKRIVLGAPMHHPCHRLIATTLSILLLASKSSETSPKPEAAGSCPHFSCNVTPLPKLRPYSTRRRFMHYGSELSSRVAGDAIQSFNLPPGDAEIPPPRRGTRNRGGELLAWFQQRSLMWVATVSPIHSVKHTDRPFQRLQDPRYISTRQRPWLRVRRRVYMALPSKSGERPPPSQHSGNSSPPSRNHGLYIGRAESCHYYRLHGS
jgi:hypothetical protein